MRHRFSGLLTFSFAAKPIAGIACIAEMLTYHVHAHLIILNHSKLVPILAAMTSAPTTTACTGYPRTMQAISSIIEALHPASKARYQFSGAYTVYSAPASQDFAKLNSGHLMEIGAILAAR